MPTMTTIVCGNPQCNRTRKVRTADVARGWGLYCGKSCKATAQEHSNKIVKKLKGITTRKSRKRR